jgi:hypothetical protein
MSMGRSLFQVSSQNEPHSYKVPLEGPREAVIPRFGEASLPACGEPKYCGRSLMPKTKKGGPFNKTRPGMAPMRPGKAQRETSVRKDRLVKSTAVAIHIHRSGLQRQRHNDQRKPAM